MQTKLFIGTRITPDLKARLGSIDQIHDFQLIPFEGREYVGTYVNSVSPTLAELRLRCNQFIEALQKYLPDLRTDNLPIVVFPQLFLG